MRNKKDFIGIFCVWFLAAVGFYKAIKFAVIHAPYLSASALCLLVLWVWWAAFRCSVSTDCQQQVEEERWRSKWDKLEPADKPLTSHQPGPVPITLRQTEIWRRELDRDWQKAKEKSAARAAGRTTGTVTKR